MSSARGMLRVLALAAALAGCSSSDDSSFQKLGALAKASLGGLAGGEPPPPPRELTRAELNAIPYATIALSFPGGPRTFLVPLAENGGYLNYLDSTRRGLVMLGGAVTGTQGLGQDLQAVRHDRADPVAHSRPLADWPARLYRDYQYARRESEPYSITLSCVFQPLARETIEIVELRFDVVRVGETCTNARRQVTNTYWVEAETGFVWKSEQWLGPHLEPATIEIIRPYGG